MAFLHVSSHEFNPGDEVTPGSARGESNFGRRTGITNDAVHMVRSHREAVFWVDQLSHARPEVKRWHIYEVKPSTPPEARGVVKWQDKIEHRAPSATVVRLRQSRNSTFDPTSRSSQARAGGIIR